MVVTLTAEQEQIRQMVREVAKNEILPNIASFDESQEFPHDLVRKLTDLGLLGVIFEEKYGGAGLSYIDYINVIEELAKADGSLGLTVAAHISLCSNHINLFGTEEQRRKYFVPLARGERLVSRTRRALFRPARSRSSCRCCAG